MTEAASLNTRDHPFGLPHLCRYFSELSPQPMVAVEGVTCIVRHANAAFLALAGAERADVIGRPFADAVPQGSANGCVGLLDRVFQTGTSECLAEQRHGTADPVYWSYAVWAILGSAAGGGTGGDDGGARAVPAGGISGGGAAGTERPIGVMIQVTDATETALFRERSVAMNQAMMASALRQHELAEQADELSARLRAAVEEKEYFIAVLSHELRTPLTPVLLAAEMLERDPHLDPDARETMRMIHRNVLQEARLIDDLLDMTRLERGKLELERRPIDLRMVVERAVETCRADLESGGLTLGVEPGDAPLVVDGDEGRLQQVFSNLLRNAIKFTPAGGRIDVRASCGEGACTVEVSDSGVGIDPDFLPRAFAAFEQDKTQARKAGLGLGLAICKTVVDLHGGAITAHSAGAGLGSTFVVVLPMLAEMPAAPADEPAAADAPRLPKPLRILLVEDHADTAHIMRRLLKVDGHAVQWAGDVAAGLKLAAAHEFDLLLSDLGLPDGTGVDLMHALRRDGSTLPGIVLSGYGQDQDVARSIEAGFAAHLVKPLSPRKLRDAITALVG